MKSSRSSYPQPGPPPRQQPPRHRGHLGKAPAGRGEWEPARETDRTAQPGLGCRQLQLPPTGQQPQGLLLPHREASLGGEEGEAGPAFAHCPLCLPVARGMQRAEPGGQSAFAGAQCHLSRAAAVCPSCIPGSGGSGLPLASPQEGFPEQNGLWGKGLHRLPARQHSKGLWLEWGQQQQVPTARLSPPSASPQPTQHSHTCS